jgi:hypothetical protein
LVAFRSLVKRAADVAGVDLRSAHLALSRGSLEAAVREQRYWHLREQLRSIVPDLRHQYTTPLPESEYVSFWEPKVRAVHAFQTKMVMRAIGELKSPCPTVVDIGDSSGTHQTYFRALIPTIGRFVSVSDDPVAVGKINARGYEAILSRGEDLTLEAPADLCLSFETLEHMTDPMQFLHKMVVAHPKSRLLFTVPYRRSGRVGNDYLFKNPQVEVILTENLHVFELSARDWVRLAYLAGWRTLWTEVYWQYPRFSPWRLMAPIWRQLDFEGFLAVHAEPDLTIAGRYAGWAS